MGTGPFPVLFVLKLFSACQGEDLSSGSWKCAKVLFLLELELLWAPQQGLEGRCPALWAGEGFG